MTEAFEYAKIISSCIRTRNDSWFVVHCTQTHFIQVAIIGSNKINRKLRQAMKQLIAGWQFMLTKHNVVRFFKSSFYFLQSFENLNVLKKIFPAIFIPKDSLETVLELLLEREGSVERAAAVLLVLLGRD